MLFSNLNVDEFNVMSASGDCLFKYGEAISKWAWSDYIVN